MSSRPEGPLTYFTDRDFGPTEDCEVVRILRAHGLNVEPHDSHFSDPENVDDHVWLRLCADNGWVPLSCDAQIRYTSLSKHAIMTGGVQLFVHVGKWPHPAKALNIVNTIGKIERAVRKGNQPRIMRIYMPSPTADELWKKGKPGTISEWLTREDWEREQRRSDVR